MEFQRSEFGERLIRHAMRDRARRETGDPTRRVGPMFSAWEEGLFHELRAPAASYVDEKKIKLHDYARAVNSSQAFAFNLFFAFRLADSDALGEVLGTALGRDLTVHEIEFEYCDDLDLLGEWRGTAARRDEPHTTCDVAVFVRDVRTRESGAVLLEVKLSEREFTQCAGRTSRGNAAREVCESAAAFFDSPERCYLRRPLRATKDRTYWSILSAAARGTLRDAYPRAGTSVCPFAGDAQQIMRNHALALALVQERRVAFSAFGLIHHDENPDVPPRWDAYHHMTALPLLFRIPATKVLRAAPESGWWPAWRRYVSDRYDLAL